VTLVRAAAAEGPATTKTAQSQPGGATCRFCGTPLHRTVVDLGMSPLCETFLDSSQLDGMEPFYPLHVRVCDECLLVQLPEYVPPEQIFTDYPYFSSYSTSWLAHAEAYVAAMVDRLRLTAENLVVELGSNDGYLLQYFMARGIPVLGIEPAGNVAEVAIARGVPTRALFFGEEIARDLSREGLSADLVVGNNVLAQVPDLNGFLRGTAILLAPNGTVTMEFPHVARLIEGNQFDTIYHEHFSYFSLFSLERIFAAHGLTIFDVDELVTHGGSLRIYARHAAAEDRPVSDRILALRSREEAAGIRDPQHYETFGARVEETKRKLLEFLIQARRAGKTIAGYGAPGKGNTLLNYCGIREDFVQFTVDRNPRKQGRFLPGTHIPIFHPDRIDELQPDYVLLLPWNLADEIMSQMAHIRSWGGQFVVPIPEVRVVP
jgi:SAM-dependent methyltransferase